MLEAFGFVRRKQTSGTSHFVFTYADRRLAIPFARPIKEKYVRKALLVVDDLFRKGEAE